MPKHKPPRGKVHPQPHPLSKGADPPQRQLGLRMFHAARSAAALRAADARARPARRGSAPPPQAPLAPAEPLSRGQAPAVTGDAPLDQLWRGLAAVAAQAPDAEALLADTRPLQGGAQDPALA